MMRWLGSMLMLLLLVACNEEKIDEPQGNPLHLSSLTRANSRLTPDANSTIKMYVMAQDTKYSEGIFTFSDSWANSGVSVKEHEQYYMYGYMPGSYTSSIATPSEGGNYSNGADLTLTGLPMFPTEDICVVVGVKKVDANTNTTEALEGNYSYLSGLANENYVNLLMDHLYSQLILQFNVDETYNALRHIKLKTVTLTSTYGQTVNATIRFRAGSSLDINSVTYTPNTTDNISKPVLESGNAFLTTTAADTSFGPFNCAPCTFDAEGTNLTLTCTYDVYNTAEDKVLRADCIATNKVKVTSMTHGVKKTLTLTIAPTYLYMLSDDDLNNPTIYVN